MMKLVVFLFTVISLNAFSEPITCKILKNGQMISSPSFNIPGKSFVDLGATDGYRLKLNNLKNSEFQIEVFDGNSPARLYSNGVLRVPSDQLKWALWSRDILLEVNCFIK